jgi:putative ABC transport system substrate-binding protein
MMNTPDPVEEGFVASLARPRGNTTGFSAMRTELVGKQQELLKEMVPQSTRIAVLANPAQPAYKLPLHQLTVTATKLGLRLHAEELRRAEELDTAFAAMTKAGANALIVLVEPRLINPQRRRIVDLAPRVGCPRFTTGEQIQAPGDSCLMGQASASKTGPSPYMWTRS